MSGGISGTSSVGSFFFDLVRSTQRHFACEEALFARAGYQDAATHAKHHALLLRQLWGSRQAFDVGQRGLSVKFLTFLGDWLTSHIEGADQQYAAFTRGELPGYSAGRRPQTVGVASDTDRPDRPDRFGGLVLVA